MKKFFILIILISLIVGLRITFIFANGEHPKSQFKEETDPKAFKILKEKSIDPKTGLPKTLNPNLFKGRAKQGYQIAKEIPQILVQMPCFCGCEAFGHENLLDCFIDNHGAGWMICQEEALLTKMLFNKNFPIDKIYEEIMKRYNKLWEQIKDVIRLFNDLNFYLAKTYENRIYTQQWC